MKFVDRLRQNEENVYTICRLLLEQLKVQVSDITLKAEIDKHPYFSSLLTIKDTLDQFGVSSGAMFRNTNEYSDFQTPFITSLQKPQWNNPYFTLVRGVSGSDIEYYNSVDLKWEKETIVNFEKWDKNVILLIEKREQNGEKDFKEVNAKYKRQKRIKASLVYAFLCLAVCSVLISFTLPAFNLYALIYFVLAMSGVICASLVSWYEIDAQNPFLKDLCSGGKKINCGAVLSTKGAKIFGVEWSVLGVGYFLASLISLLVVGLYSLKSFAVLSLISILVSPYILYSVFYQYKVVKQWCPLCLATQGVLFLQLISSVLFLRSADIGSLIDIRNIMNILVLYTFIMGVVVYMFPYIKKAKLGRMYELRWRRLQANPNVFNALLMQQPKIQNYPYDLGITLGNPVAETEIIKVCNPYCGPCSRAHPLLEEIINNNKNVKVRVIFTAEDNDKDIKAKPVRHLMALATIKSPKEMQQVLDDWYLSEKIHKDYDLFAQKYPLNGELTKQGEKLSKMSKWCDEMKIRATPTFFINGHEMVETYSVEDLKEIFTN